jgi:hypothetical protein
VSLPIPRPSFRPPYLLSYVVSLTFVFREKKKKRTHLGVYVTCPRPFLRGAILIASYTVTIVTWESCRTRGRTSLCRRRLVRSAATRALAWYRNWDLASGLCGSGSATASGSSGLQVSAQVARHVTRVSRDVSICPNLGLPAV